MSQSQEDKDNKPKEKVKRKAKSHPKEPDRQLATRAKGARLRVGNHRLIIPPGAVGQDQWFTFSEPSSEYIRVEIQAEGRERYDFEDSTPKVRLELDHSDKDGKWRELYIYETDKNGEPTGDPLPGNSESSEGAPAKVVGYLEHLSGYVVGGGRVEAATE